MAFIYQLLVAYCLLIPAIQGIQKRNDFSGLKELLRPRRETCDETQYYDHVTKNCDECAPQCDRHSQSPPTACEQFCKHRTKGKDLPKPTCDTGTYHDEITGNCDPCGPHCYRIPLDVPPPPCRNYCRDSEKSQGEHATAVSETSKELTAWAIGLIIVLALLVVYSVAGFFVLWYHRQQARKNIRLDVPETEPMKRSVIEDTNESERTEMVLNPSNV